MKQTGTNTAFARKLPVQWQQPSLNALNSSCLKILSYGGGMQSTALALMSCEKAMYEANYPFIPKYDAIIFCDLSSEPPWVYQQVDFVRKQCELAGIPFYILHTDLDGNFRRNFGHAHTTCIPFWSISPDGKPAKLWRHCTIDYKIIKIQQFIKYQLMDYKYREKVRPKDKQAHEIHLGFSAEEMKRVSVSQHPMFVNRYPLIDMEYTRVESYAYCLDTWGLKTLASSCTFCPFHRNYFFQHLKNHYPKDYQKLVLFDELLEREQPNTMIRSKIFVSRSRKRISDLTEADCNDAETFLYHGNPIWNGF